MKGISRLLAPKDAGEIYLYFDGCCEPRNPGGTAGWGCFAVREKKTIFKASGIYTPKQEGQTSNNIAEYEALIRGMTELVERKLNHIPVVARGDSMMVVRQMSGDWKIKKGMYVKSATEALEIAESFTDISFEWIPREENQRADDLSKDHLKKSGVRINKWK